MQNGDWSDIPTDNPVEEETSAFNEERKLPFSMPSPKKDKAKTVLMKGMVKHRSSSVDNSRPPSLKRSQILESPTPYPPPLPPLNVARKSQSLPIIKITDFDDGECLYYDDIEESDDEFDQDESPYGTQDLLRLEDDDETEEEREDEDQNDEEEAEEEENDGTIREYIEQKHDKRTETSTKNKKSREGQTNDKKHSHHKVRPSSSVTTYKQYKLEEGKTRKKRTRKKMERRSSLSEIMDTLSHKKRVNFKDIDDFMSFKDSDPILAGLKAPANMKPIKEKSLAKPKGWNGGDYSVSGPQGDDLYVPNSARPLSLPPLHAKHTARRSRSRNEKSGKPNSVLYPYIHGLSRTVDSSMSSAKSSLAAPSATTVKSKDDSRIQYEYLDEGDIQPFNKSMEKVTEPWRARKIRIFRNGDRFFPGMEYTFRIGRDVLNLESLLEKISDRIGLSRGARYLFGLDGVRKFRLEELEDGGFFVASSDRKFANLAYNKRRPGWRKRVGNKAAANATNGSTAVKLPGKRGDSSDSGNSTESGNGKPSSREGRRIKVINTEDKTQEVSVLVNLKTVQSWEEVVADLGRALKLRGGMQLLTVDGQEVKSFSMFKNDYATEETFYLVCNEETKSKGGGSRPGSPSNFQDGATTPRRRDDKKKMRSKHGYRHPRSNLRRYASEPTLKEGSVTLDEEMYSETIEARPVSILIDGVKRVFYPPRASITHNPSPPSHTIALDWVYGYRGADTKRNLWVVSTEELLYFVAAVAVLYDRRQDTQRHYTEHTEDIQCMSLHPYRDLVVSGQRATRGQKMSAHVRVWSLRSLNTLHVLGEKELGVGIMAVAFSRKSRGQLLLAIDADQEHLLSVWNWESERLLGKVATHQDFIYGAYFHPMDNNLIIIFGRKLLSLWVRRKDGIFTRSNLLKDKENAGITITSLEFIASGDLMTGDTEGQITLWSINLEGKYYAKLEFAAHDGPVSALQQLSEGTILSGGEKDKRIVAWDADEDFEKVEEARLPDLAGGVRSIYLQRPGERDGNIYVGTTRNMILEGSLQRKFNQIVFGHSKQLWGVAVNPNDGTVATAGYDKQIVKWRHNRPDWRIQAQGECVSTAIHPYSTVITTGTIDGHLVVLNAHSGMHLITIRVCSSPISCLAYNLHGDILVAGSQNGSLYLFRTSRDGFIHTRCGRMSGFQPLSCVDWSESGTYIQTVTSDNDITYWNLRSLAAVKNPAEVRDETWLTQTCPLGYMTLGIWAGIRNSPVQLTVDKNENRKLLIAGDTEGFLRLYRYPVLSPKAGYHEYKVYTSYLSGARFSPEEDYLYTIGGTDAALMRWRIE